MWTLDAATRRDYVQGMTRLSVWYVRTLLEQRKISADQVEEALLERVNLFRLTEFWDGRRDGDNGLEVAPWRALTAQLAERIRVTPMVDVAGLEDRAVSLLEAVLEGRIPADLGPPPVRPFGCWTYDPGWAGLGDRPGLLGKLSNTRHLVAAVRTRLGMSEPKTTNGVLHIMNVVVPRSPFDDMAALAASLRALIAEVRVREPAIQELWCNTWLNDHPVFHKIFPEAWFANASVSPAGNYRNWWGQFVRRDGGFNAKVARRFRESGGVFPYRALQCHARLNEVDAFLAERFP